MITELHVRGFKSLHDVRIPFAPDITVMVGANNSGKSNALSALRLLGESARSANFEAAVSAMGGYETLLTRGEHGMSLSVSNRRAEHVGKYEVGVTLSDDRSLTLSQPETLTIGSTAGQMQLEYRTRGQGPQRELHARNKDSSWLVGSAPPSQGGLLDYVAQGNASNQGVMALRTELRQIEVFDFSVAALRAEARLRNSQVINPDGTNFAAVLDALANTRPDVIENVIREIGPPVTSVKRILTPLGSSDGTKVIGIQETDGSVYRADEISDGVLLFIALSVVAQLAGTRPSLIAVEEPERGIHPRRIRDLIDQFRRVAEMGTQIVLTTHSPLVLDEFRDFPESVLIFDRDGNGTRVQKLSDHLEWKEGLMFDTPLGDLWYSGLLGGIPQ